MSTESILSLLIGFVLGLFSGIYAGFVIARAQKFADLRSQAKRVILEIDFISTGNSIEFPKRKVGSDLSLIASEMFSYGHKKAGEILFGMNSEVNQSIHLASNGQIPIEKFNDQYLDWQHRINVLSSNKRKICSPWPGL